MGDAILEPGSFRDRRARVFYHDGGVFRGLGEEALRDWERLSQTQFFSRLMAAGKIVPTERSDDVPGLVSAGWAAVLRHQAIPFVSYPYEWSFGMLHAAALLHLDILLDALGEGMILKDSSAFNIQWTGADPVFIDVASFERLAPGQPWVGYRQFCQMFLYPLFLQAYRDIPFQPWLRGAIDGIEPAHCRNILSARDRLRPGVFTHVYLQSKLEDRYGGQGRDVSKEVRGAGFHKELIEANVRRLRRLVEGLTWKSSSSEWATYAERHGYDDADHEAKRAFVAEACAGRRRRLVWDIGCNAGAYSRIAAEYADYVVAMDADALVIDRLHRALQAETHRSILPLVVDLADPSPDLGWRGLERKSLDKRGTPELTLCLALIHHAVIGANIPLVEFVDWLAGLGSALVIEFVTRSDPMVARLLQNKRDDYDDYNLEFFEKTLASRFTIQRRAPIGTGTRILYFALPRRP